MPSMMGSRTARKLSRRVCDDVLDRLGKRVHKLSTKVHWHCAARSTHTVRHKSMSVAHAPLSNGMHACTRKCREV